MIEFRTINFGNTASGQARKVEVLGQYAAAGWRVVSETVTPGRFKTDEACCLALIWPPLGFLAGHEEGWITVTLQRDAEALTEEQRQLGEELDARSAAEFNRAQEETVAANFTLSVLIGIGILIVLLLIYLSNR